MAEPGMDLFVQACLLLLLRERPGTRPELVHRMRAFDHVDAVDVGRVLRALVGAGEARSSWHPFSAGSGPRRSYRITGRGVVALARQASMLELLHGTMHLPGIERAD